MSIESAAGRDVAQGNVEVSGTLYGTVIGVTMARSILSAPRRSSINA
ncbi:MAG: hypothetical protein HGA65_09710 [Oscillochloris sp.]|nr:hypothetical protein [Oscillochloris sp.]